MNGRSVGSGLTIVIVEDDLGHRELIKEAMKEANILNDTVYFENGVDAIEYLFNEQDSEGDENCIGLVMLDMQLPKMNGLEVLQKIKENERTASIPVVMLTSSEREEDMKKSYELGANSYITKPISFGAFVETVKSIPYYWIMVNQVPGGN